MREITDYEKKKRLERQRERRKANPEIVHFYYLKRKGKLLQIKTNEKPH